MNRQGAHLNGRPSILEGGFTLVEMLVVMAILAILLALTVPAIVSLQQSDNLTSAGQIVVNQINLARQLASTTNRTVQIRLIQMPATSPNGYCAIQIWSAGLNLSSSANFTTALVMAPISRLIILPQTAISAYSASSNLSQLLAGLTTGQMQAGTVSNANYEAFQVAPSGIVTPSVALSSSYLTVVSARTAGATTIPANYVSVQVDPQTGAARAYRP